LIDCLLFFKNNKQEMSKREVIHQEKLDWYRNNLALQTYMCSSKIDSVLYYLHEYYRDARPRVPAGFKKNLLAATQAINEYAASYKIRFEDAVLVLHDYATTAPANEVIEE